MENLFLKYGDLIWVYSGQNKKTNQISQGFLSSTGFLNDNIFLQSNEEKGINILENLNKIRNIRDMIFQVVPKLNYEFHKSYKTTLDSYEYYEKLIDNDKKKIKNSSSDLLDSLKIKLKRLEARKKKEVEINQSIIKDKEGKNVLYGADIQLMHYDSKMFLEGFGECAPTKEIGYIVKLSNWFSKNMIFRILPKFKAMCEGQEIQYEDHIIIYSVNLETNLKCDYEEKINKENEIKPSIYNPLRPFHIHFDKDTTLYKTLLGRTNFHWQILYCGLYIKNNVQGLSLCNIIHCESDSSIIIKQNKGFLNLDNKNHSLGIFEISLIDNQNKIKDIQYGDNIILKQFFTGYNLSTNNKNELIGSENLFENSLFNLSPISNNKNYFKAFFLKNNKNQLVIENYHNSNLIELEYDNTVFYPLEKELISEKLVKLVLQKNKSYENSFKFELINEDLKLEILFIKSAFPILKKFIFSLEESKNFKISDETLSRFKKKIELLIDFLYRKDFIVSKKREFEPIINRQKIFHESHLLDLLIDCIYLPFKNGYINIKNLNKYSFLRLSLHECHKTLRESIKEYRPGELACSQWFSIFLNQTLKTNDNNDIGAGSTLTELIDNNENILKYRIKEDIIEKFTNFLIKKEKDKRIVEIIKALCVCNNKPIKKNQNFIIEQILKNDENKELIIVLKILIDEEVRLYLKEEDKWIGLSKIKGYSKKNNGSKFFKYFISLLSLYSDLCFGRNHRAIRWIEPILEFKIIYNCIINNDLCYKLRGVFAKIVLVLWIDINPHFEEKIPSKIIVKGNNIKFKNERNFKIDKIIEFILNYIKIETQLNFKLIKFINILLNLIIKILELGIIVNIDELNKIIESIIYLLKSIDNIEKINKLKLKERNLIFELYITIIKILDIIENYNINLKISNLIENKNINYEQVILDNHGINSTGNFLISCLLKIFMLDNNELKENSLSLIHKKTLKSLEFYYNIKDILILNEDGDIINYKKLYELKNEFLKILEKIDISIEKDQINNLKNIINNWRFYLIEINEHHLYSFIDSFGENSINVLSLIIKESIEIDIKKQIILEKMGFKNLLFNFLKIVNIDQSKDIIFLLYLINKNKKNNYKFEYLWFFINLFKKNYEIYEIILIINEIIKNNDSLINNKKRFYNLINELLYFLNANLTEKERHYYKFFIYYILQYTYKYNNSIISKNQDYVINLFAENIEIDLEYYFNSILISKKNYYDKKNNGKNYFYLSSDFNILYLIFKNILNLIKEENNYCIQILNAKLPFSKIYKLYNSFENIDFFIIIIKNLLLKFLINTFNFNESKLNINILDYFNLISNFNDNLEEVLSLITSFKNQNLIVINFKINNENEFFIKFILLGIDLIKKLLKKINFSQNFFKEYNQLENILNRVLELLISNYTFLIDFLKEKLDDFIEIILNLNFNWKKKKELKVKYLDFKKRINEKNSMIENKKKLIENIVDKTSENENNDEYSVDNKIDLNEEKFIRIQDIDIENKEFQKFLKKEKNYFFELLDSKETINSNNFLLELINFSLTNNNLLYENISLIYDRFKNNKINKEIEIKIAELICELIPKDIDNNIWIKILKLGIDLLESRGEKMQKIFYDIFQKDIKMDFLESLEKIINKSLNLFINFLEKMNKDRIEKFFNNNNNQWKINYSNENKLIIISTLIFRFLQLLCEGHNKILQDYLREQKINNKANVNFILLSINFFGKFSKNPQTEFINLIEQNIDFLIESCQGPCKENQKCLYENKIIEFSGQLLNELNNFIENSNEWSNLFNKTVILLNSILEGNNNINLKKNMAKIIDLEILLNSLHFQLISIIGKQQFLKYKKSNIIKRFKEKMNEKLNEAFGIFFFIQYINIDTKIYVYKIDNIFKKNPDYKYTYNFFENNTAKIEIVFEGNIETVFFIIQPPCRYLDESTKNRIVDNLNRNTPNEKISDLMNNVPFLIDEMVYLEKLKNRFIGFNPQIFKSFRFWSILLSIAINLLILITIRKTAISNKFFNYEDKSLFGYRGPIFSYMGLIQLVASACLLIFWLYIFGPWELMNKWRRYFIDLKKNVDKRKKIWINNILENPLSSIKNEHFIEILTDKKENKFNKIKYHIMNFLFIFNNKIIIYWMVYFLASLIAYHYDFFFLYSFHLLDIINREERLLNVIKAITHNKKQLISTAVLGIIIIYIYSSFGYFYVIDTFFNPNIGLNGENMCSTLLHCFFVVLSLGPRSSGSIGDVLERQSYSTDNLYRYWIRYIYDLSCFFIINVIFMNIIFGIIIDTFADLRDTKKNKEEDAKNYCMICSIDRNTFDKDIINGFELHEQEDHNPWNYLYFIYYLKIKDKNELNGIESDIFDKMRKDDISWFPVLRSKKVKEVFEDKEDNTEEKLIRLHNKLVIIKNKFQLLKNKSFN